MKAPSLHGLKFKEYDEDVIVSLDEFIAFIRSHQSKEYDKRKAIKRCNVVKEISHHVPSGVVCVGTETYIRSISVMRYFFNHCDDFALCRSVCIETTKALLKDSESVFSSGSLLDLYTAIASANFNLDEVTGLSQSLLSESEGNLPLLFISYKGRFSNAEWIRIIQFEQHFKNAFPTMDEQVEYEKVLETKWSYFRQCKSAKEIGIGLQKFCHDAIIVNQKRQSATEALTEMSIVIGDTKHNIKSLEDLLRAELISVTAPNTVGRIVCIGCGKRCNSHRNGIHVIIETEDQDGLDDLAKLIQLSLENNHSIDTTDVVIVAKESLTMYFPNGIPQRFKLYDDLFQGCLSDCVMGTFLFTSPQNQNQLDLLPELLCTVCFRKHLPFVDKPLGLKSFHLVDEWMLQIPLPLQCLMENAFINTDSLRNMDDKCKGPFVKGKLGRLYFLVESCFNILNMKYRGVLQNAATDELMLYYHHSTIVLGITSQYGVSASHKTAARRLEMLADPDRCYKDAYIKKHPLIYQSSNDTDKEMKEVSMRDCHTILQIDNLVRWSFRDDPKPGESRAVQIDTLPITLKGLPKDSKEVESWHLPSCSGEECQCKRCINLTKEDADKVIFCLNPDEEMASRALQMKAKWGLSSVWQKLQNIEEFLGLLDGPHADAIDDLNETFGSLFIMDPVDEISDRDLQKEFGHLIIEEETDHEPDVDHDPDETIITGNVASWSPTGQNESVLAPNAGEDGELSLDLSSVSDCSSESGLDHLPSYSDISGDEELMVFDDILFSERPSTEKSACEATKKPDPQQFELGKVTISSFDTSFVMEEEPDMQEYTSMPNVFVSEDSNISTNPSLEYSSVLHNKPFQVPPLLSTHPVPATGRDDDINNLKEVLDDILYKLGADCSHDRILCAADHKIAKNIFLLKEKDPKYQLFLCEFPLLHLRKSKITNLVAAYKDCGILHLLKYMKDEDKEDDWTKLLTISNIEKATRYIWRLSTALHLAFFIRFQNTLTKLEASKLKEDMLMKTICDLEATWGNQLTSFLENGSKKNSIFSLHREMMEHCDEIVALGISERIGGPEGYCLLLSVIKSSLPFCFLNGSSSYAKFCVQLLIEHFEAGPFHQNLKKTLFTTPHSTSTHNFGLDTQREMDHKIAVKAFRPGSNLKAIVTRMSVIDWVEAIHQIRKCSLDDNKKQSPEDLEVEEAIKNSETYMGKDISKTDLNHIMPVLQLILRRAELSTAEDDKLVNVYSRNRQSLSQANLDSQSFDCGNYLIRKMLSQMELLGFTTEDLPDVSTIHGPKPLLQKIKSSKGVTIFRSKCKIPKQGGDEEEKKEMKRKQEVKRKTKIEDCRSSKQNTCQAVIKPDCTKSATNKSAGIKKALKFLLVTCGISKMDDLILEKADTIPEEISTKAKISIIEFAGLKFKTFANSGRAYLEQIQRYLKKLHFKLPSLSHIIICEEKYLFTPDNFKAATRAKRVSKENTAIFHLRQGTEILSSTRFSKSSILGTSDGKKMVSLYLGKHIQELTLHHSLTLDIDSESITSPCVCQDGSSCSCIRYTTPLRAQFAQDGLLSVEELQGIQQRKGEAEMAQVDWLMEVTSELQEGDLVVDCVSSADIDTVYIHIFTVALHWPRNGDGSFKWPVLVWLQKTSPDLFNITGIVKTIEDQYPDVPRVATTIAVILCMGGNDFLPKMHNISHEKLLKTIISDPLLLSKLIRYTTDLSGKVVNAVLERPVYFEVIKRLYCPLSLDYTKLSLDEVRQHSIKPPGKNFKHPQTWMPPPSALDQVCHLIDSQIAYLLTTWDHAASLPDFLTGGCLRKNETTGAIFYDFGPDEHFDSEKELLVFKDHIMQEKVDGAKKRNRQKRKQAETPQKGARRKRSGRIASTPMKDQVQESSDN